MRDLAWSVEQLGAALDALGRAARLAAGSPDELAAPAWLTSASDRALGLWIEAAATSLEMEAEGAAITHGEIARLLRSGGPALLRVPAEKGDHYLALLDRRGDRARFVTPARTVKSMSLGEARALLVAGIEEPLTSDLDQLLDEMAVAGARRAHARTALLDARLGGETIAHAWYLRLPPGAGFARQLARAGVMRRFVAMGGAHAAQYLLFLASWWVVGRAALEGSLDRGWLVAWGLLLLTIVPLRALLTWSQGMFAVTAGGLLKQRLLFGATRLEPEEVRREGAGQMLGQVIESEAVESLALSGGVQGLMALIELVLALAILAIGAGGALQVAVAVAWLGFALWLAARYLGRRRAWTITRMKLTNDLVEHMVGHRTRVAQEPRSRWHEGEDHAIESYLQHARDMDTSAARLVTLIPRGWVLVALLALAPAIVRGEATTIGIAVALGGVLLAHQALEKLVAGLGDLADARIAWQQVAPLFAAAARSEARGEPAFACGAAQNAANEEEAAVSATSLRGAAPVPAAAGGATASAPHSAAPLVDASELVFGHHGRAEPVLRGLHLRLGASERVLLEGRSGSGKSTLAALLSGLRVPDSGLILLDGLDRHTLGAEGWHRRVAAAPQFHENHVLTGTLAFNLLMGRRWPAPPEDLAEAETLCRELGLGPLVDRMPAGMMQMVGESGWQLSHGERSRLYMARALLQGAELVVLDESFAALDPETLEQSVRCAVERAPALLVIAHP